MVGLLVKLLLNHCHGMGMSEVICDGSVKHLAWETFGCKGYVVSLMLNEPKIQQKRKQGRDCDQWVVCRRPQSS